METNEKIAPLLARLGLNDKEVRVFLTLLAHGDQLASGIARFSGITRTHVYDIAESLHKRGLVTVAEVRGARRYGTISHNGLLEYAIQKQKSFAKLERDLTEAASDFNALKSSTRPKTAVRFFEGADGIRQILNEVRSDIKKSGDLDMVTIFPVDRLVGGVNDLFDNALFINFANVNKRDIIEDGPMARVYIDKCKEGPVKHSYKIWPKKRGELLTDTVCWGDKVEISDVEDPAHVSGILITNHAFANTYRQWFNQLWDSLPENKG